MALNNQAKIEITAVDNTRSAFDSVKSSMQSMASASNGVTNALSAISSAGAVAMFVSLATSALKAADAMNDVAKANEVTVGAVLQLSNALQLNGGEADNASKLFSSLTNKLDEAAGGGAKAQSNFQKVGVSMKDLATLDGQQLFEKTLKGLADIHDPITRNALAMELFGKAVKGVDIVGLASQYSDNKGKFDDSEKAFNAIGHSFDTIDNAMNRVSVNLATNIGPAWDNFITRVLGSDLEKEALTRVDRINELSQKIAYQSKQLSEVSSSSNQEVMQKVRSDIDAAKKEMKQLIILQSEAYAAAHPVDKNSQIKRVVEDSPEVIQARERAAKEAQQAADKRRAAQLKELQHEYEQYDDNEQEKIKTQYENNKKSVAAHEKMRQEFLAMDEKYSKITLDSENKILDEKYKKEAELAKKTQDEIFKKNKEFWDSVEGTAHKVWTEVWQGGSNVFTNIGKVIKSAILDMLYQITVKKWIVGISASVTGGAISNAVADTGELGSASGSSSSGFMSSASNIFTMIKNGNASIVGGIESVGASIANGMGGIRDSIGGFMGENASAIADGFSYAGALIALSQGKIATAIGTAIGTMTPLGPIGGAIGGMIGGFVDSLFGSSHQIPSTGAGASGSYKNGIYTAGAIDQAGASGMGDPSGVMAVNKAFQQNLGAYLAKFGVNDSINSTTGFAANARKNFSSLGGTINGKAFGNYSETRTYAQLVGDVFGSITVEAIKQSSLSKSLTQLFNGITDKTKVANMMNATLSLQAAQLKLADSFGLTVEKAAEAAKATGLTGDALTSFISGIVNASGANSPAAVLLAAKKNLLEIIGGDLPATLKGYDDLIKGIDKSNATGINKVAKLLGSRAGFEQYTNSIDSLRGGVKGTLAGIVSSSEKQAMMNADLDKLFTENNLAVPGSIQELIDLGKTLMTTESLATEAGLNLAAAFPNLVSAFNQTRESANALFDSLMNKNSFTSLAELRNYTGVSNNYGNEFAADYIANSRTGAIGVNSQGKAVRTSDNNTELVALLKELRDLSKQNLIQSKDSTNTLQRMDRVGIPVRA